MWYQTHRPRGANSRPPIANATRGSDRRARHDHPGTANDRRKPVVRLFPAAATVPPFAPSASSGTKPHCRFRQPPREVGRGRARDSKWAFYRPMETVPDPEACFRSVRRGFRLCSSLPNDRVGRPERHLGVDLQAGPVAANLSRNPTLGVALRQGQVASCACQIPCPGCDLTT